MSLLQGIAARSAVAAAVLSSFTLAAIASCGGDADTSGTSSGKADGGPDSSADGSGAAAGMGGVGGTAGAAGTAGSAGGPGDCVHTGPPLIDPTTLPECPLCDNARCVPTALVPADAVDLLADCEGGMAKCVPDEFVATGGNFLLESCRSLNDSEGRCVSLCVPQVASQASFLPQSTCADDERCAPCFDPRTGEPSGACGLACDPGATEPPVTFDKCCGSIGSCVPTSAVPVDLQSLLGADTCTGADQLCAPDQFADSTFTPMPCRSVNDSEGRCIPDCIPEIAAQASLLPKDVCPDQHLCAPCFDPTTGMDTGSCTLNGDMPNEPPTTFDPCCGGIGSCVPESLVPPAQQSLLGTDTCSGSGTLCAPTELITSTFQPPECNSIGGFEGRCLPACLPDIAAQASRLPQDTCASTHLCAPCFDPITGVDTGACSLNGDMPNGPPQTFDKCCNGIGSCVPPSLVPPAQQSLLGQDTCSGSTDLCAPDDLADSSFVPPTCTVWPSGDGNPPDEDFEGRCLPACLPDIAAQASRLEQGSCAANHLCAPCWDPITGADTGACGLNGDAPATPASQNTFDRCCMVTGGELKGVCAPDALIPPANLGQVPVDTCTAGHHCVPEPQAIDPNAQFPSCDSTGHCADSPGIGAGSSTGPGACLPECLLQSNNPDAPIPDFASAGQRDCQTGEVCVPCNLDLCVTNGCSLCFLGSCSTGACGGAGDCPT